MLFFHFLLSRLSIHACFLSPLQRNVDFLGNRDCRPAESLLPAMLAEVLGVFIPPARFMSYCSMGQEHPASAANLGACVSSLLLFGPG